MSANNDVNTTQEKNNKRNKIDFTKEVFTQSEKTIIKREASLIKDKYPHHVPIIVRVKGDIVLIKRKFLVGGEITVAQFMFILRKKMQNMNPSEALFLFVNNTIPQSVTTLQNLYLSNKDPETDMLFFTVCKENTFGKSIKKKLNNINCF